MCDCYMDYCANCKRPIPMHLGDFRTKRFEVQVFCWECWPLVKRKYEGKRYVVWEISDISADLKEEHSQLYERDKRFLGKFVVVVALTENAWENWRVNHPNLFLNLQPRRSPDVATAQFEEEKSFTIEADKLETGKLVEIERGLFALKSEDGSVEIYRAMEEQ